MAGCGSEPGFLRELYFASLRRFRTVHGAQWTGFDELELVEIRKDPSVGKSGRGHLLQAGCRSPKAIIESEETSLKDWSRGRSRMRCGGRGLDASM